MTNHDLRQKLLAVAACMEDPGTKWAIPILDEAIAALTDSPLTVSFKFDKEDEAKLFSEYAQTAFSLWKFNTGRLNKPHCNLSTRDELERASPKTTGHTPLLKEDNE